MKVGIGVIAGTVGGPATYGRELVRALAALPTPHRFVVFTDDPQALAGVDVEMVAVPLRSPWRQPLWDHWRVPRLLARHGVDLYHGTKGVLPIRSGRGPWQTGRCRGVVTVHDLAVYTHPRTFAAAQRWHLRVETPRTLRAAARVIADSEHTRADVLRRFALPAETVVTIPLGVGPAFHPADPERIAALRARHGLARPMILYAGTVQPRKNVDLVVAAYHRLGTRRPAAGGGPPASGWDLVIAGRLRPGHRPAWLAAAAPAGGASPGVVWLGPVPQDELAVLYSAADVLVTPSAYEGFGLTVVEAMACGCPVVSVATSSVSEVAGSAAFLIDAPEVEALVAALDRVLSDPALRAELRASGRQRAAGFTWEATARRTLAVYDDVAARRLR
jgi:glycosyltransferase involved in cell wall biosynthesis